jgi:peptidoglycan LD-endopeptidase LytH
MNRSVERAGVDSIRMNGAALVLILSILITRVGPPPDPDPATPSVQIGRRQHGFPVPGCQAASYGPTHHDYPATDIFVVRGTRFLAVTSGIVEGVSRIDRWKPNLDRAWTRGGRFVSLVGDDGVRYYGSHLLSVAAGIGPGDRVRVGQLLGFTGQSGNARLSVPHLHFGISHPTTPTDWMTRRGEVWPYRYLRAWCAGRDPTPDLPGRALAVRGGRGRNSGNPLLPEGFASGPGWT